MPRLLQRYATPLVLGLFLVSLVSGSAMFFNVGGLPWGRMHEWLSMVLILPFVLHLWKNWRSFLGYFGRAPMSAALAASALAAAGFAVTSPGGEGDGRPPQFAFAHAVLTSSPAKLATVFGESPEDLTARLTAAGFTVAGPDEALSEIARSSGKNEVELVRALLPPDA